MPAPHLVSSASLGRAGLGLRRSFLTELCHFYQTPNQALPSLPDFLEVAPENWIGVGGAYQAKLKQIAEHVPIVAHGLSLNLGGTDPIDQNHVAEIAKFINEFSIPVYSDHLSACAIDGHLYDLMPLAFNQDSVKHISARIRQVQDQLGRRIAVENSSYYCALSNEMSELDFINAILLEADCQMLLDVNNVYVNAFNHSYDAKHFISALPADRISYLHIAGHHLETADLIVDTHGSDVSDPVWQLLQFTHRQIGVRPTLLERDFDIPALPQLINEAVRLREFAS